MNDTIYNLPWAWFLAGNNELKLRAKTAEEAGDPRAADALMFRFQVPAENLTDRGTGWIGAIAADVMRNGVERVQLKFGLKLEPDPVLELWVTRLGSDGNDADEKRVFQIGLRGAEFDVPLKGVGVPAGGGGQVTRFYTDGGKFCFNFQDADGTPGCVIYRVNGTDESTWEAVGTMPIQLF